MKNEAAHPARSLEALHRRETSYEVVAILPNGERIRLGFTSRPSRTAFLRLAQNEADAILPHLTDDDTIAYSAAGGLNLGPVVVRKSGRTERECALDRRVG